MGTEGRVLEAFQFQAQRDKGLGPGSRDRIRLKGCDHLTQGIRAGQGRMEIPAKHLGVDKLLQKSPGFHQRHLQMPGQARREILQARTPLGLLKHKVEVGRGLHGLQVVGPTLSSGLVPALQVPVPPAAGVDARVGPIAHRGPDLRFPLQAIHQGLQDTPIQTQGLAALQPGPDRKPTGWTPGSHGHARKETEGRRPAAHPAEVFQQGALHIPGRQAFQGTFQQGVQPRGKIWGGKSHGFPHGVAPDQIAKDLTRRVPALFQTNPGGIQEVHLPPGLVLWRECVQRQPRAAKHEKISGLAGELVGHAGCTSFRQKSPRIGPNKPRTLPPQIPQTAQKKP